MISLLIDILVCVLLATTIGYCIVLDRRLRVLKADEQVLRRVIGDLVGATDRAEKAVAGLRGVVAECNETVATHLREAERHSEGLAAQIRSGDDVIARIARIVETARGGSSEPAAPVQPELARAADVPGARPPLRQTLAAAQAFAERAQRRLEGARS